MTERNVWVRHRFAGWHYWPEAPEERGYLGEMHRHLFEVECAVPVARGDREIEFHDLLAWVQAACLTLGERAEWTGGLDLGAQSCEMLAEKIARNVHDALFADRAVTVTVSEDGECGATVTVR